MWFAPPQELATRVFTRMPAQHRRLQRTEWADANRAGAPVDCFLEGPCFDAVGRLLVVDIPFGRIFRIEGDAWVQLAEFDGWPNGLKVLPDGMLLAADYRRGLVRIDPASGATRAGLQTVMSEGFKGVNDLTLHRDGVDKPIEVSLLREVIKIQVVKDRMEPDNIGYIRLSQFTELADSGIKNAVQQLKAARR